MQHRERRSAFRPRPGRAAPDDDAHFSAALVARDLGDDGPEPERRFDFAVTYERSLVLEAALAAMSRIAPAAPSMGGPRID